MSKPHIKRTAGGVPALVYKEGKAGMMSFTGKSGVNGSPAASPAEHKTPLASTEETLNTVAGKWIPWGFGDTLPRDLALLIRKSPVGRAGLRRTTKDIYGQRLFTYKVTDYTGDGEAVIQYVKEPEWEQIMRRSNFNIVRIGLYQDFAYYDINFPELRFNGNKTKVYGVDYQKASHCRLGQVNPSTGYIDKVFISGRFPNVRPEDCDTLPVIDCIRYPDQIEDIRKDYKNFKYIMPQFWPDPLNDYYPEVFWYSAKDHIEVEALIQSYTKAMLKNQVTIKYHIQIPFEYLYELYPKFQSMGEDEQDKIVEELYDEIIDCLTGAENAAKALMSFFKTGQDGKPQGKWIIETIEDKLKTDAWLPSENAAGSQIQFAMMLNPALSGQGNTGGSGNARGGANNGGSNIRESGLDRRALQPADRDINHSLFNFCKEFNGWDPELLLGVQDMVQTTLDQGTGSKKVVS
jgi:hypothetical protein